MASVVFSSFKNWIWKKAVKCRDNKKAINFNMKWTGDNLFNLEKIPRKITEVDRYQFASERRSWLEINSHSWFTCRQLKVEHFPGITQRLLYQNFDAPNRQPEWIKIDFSLNFRNFTLNAKLLNMQKTATEPSNIELLSSCYWSIRHWAMIIIYMKSQLAIYYSIKPNTISSIANKLIKDNTHQPPTEIQSIYLMLSF